jgi:hypothetical protein
MVLYPYVLLSCTSSENFNTNCPLGVLWTNKRGCLRLGRDNWPSQGDLPMDMQAVTKAVRMPLDLSYSPLFRFLPRVRSVTRIS